MASYDQLSAQQRAIVDLILKRGQTYEELADKLDLPQARVRELAHDALTSLAPVSAAAVDDGWRGQLADYLLGQQPGADAARSRAHLRGSEAARAWSRSVLDSLEHLYSGDLPTIPTGEAGEQPAAPRRSGSAGFSPAATGELSPEAAAIVRRRRIAAAAAAGVALLLAIVLVWPVGVLTGGGDDPADSGADQAGEETELVGQVVLRPTEQGSDDAGLAIVTRQGDRFDLALQAQLAPTRRNQAYEVWLYNTAQDAESLGAQVTDDQGRFAGRAELPDNFRDYRFIDISRETVDEDATHSGTSVLRARTAQIRPPQQQPGQQPGQQAPGQQQLGPEG